MGDGGFEAHWEQGGTKSSVTGRSKLFEQGNLTIDLPAGKQDYKVISNGKEGMIIIPLRAPAGLVHELYFTRKEKICGRQYRFFICLRFSGLAAQEITHVQKMGPATVSQGCTVLFEKNFWNGSTMVYSNEGLGYLRFDNRIVHTSSTPHPLLDQNQISCLSVSQDFFLIERLFKGRFATILIFSEFCSLGTSDFFIFA